MIKNNFGGRVVYRCFQIFGWLPAWWHYAWSFIISLLLQYVVRYRRKVVREQLSMVFKDRSNVELKSLERAFYRHLSDLFVESIMMTSFDVDRFSRHVSITNPELIEEAHTEVDSIFFLLGHYGNWEWFTGCQCLLPKTEFNVIYKHQNGIGHYITSRLRSKFGSLLIDKYNAPRQIIKERNDNVHRTYIFVADQSPAINKTDLFVHFLGQETAVITGMERLAKLRQSAVFYIDTKLRSRGRYELTLIKLADNAEHLSQHQLTYDFMKHLEANILRQPELWLWSHRRWKVTPQMVYDQFPHKDIEII